MAKNTQFHFVMVVDGKGHNATVQHNGLSGDAFRAWPVAWPSMETLEVSDPVQSVVMTRGGVHSSAIQSRYNRTDHYDLLRIATNYSAHHWTGQSGTLGEFLTTGPQVVDTDLGLRLIDGLNAWAAEQQQ